MHHLDTLSLHHFYDELPRFADIPHHPQMNMHILVYTMKTPFAYKSIAQVPCYRTWFSFSCCIRSFSSISRSSSCCLSSAAFSGPHSRVYSTIAMVQFTRVAASSLEYLAAAMVIPRVFSGDDGRFCATRPFSFSGENLQDQLIYGDDACLWLCTNNKV